jgi:zinc protease
MFQHKKQCSRKAIALSFDRMKLPTMVAVAALAATALAEPIQVDGFTHIRTVGDIQEYRLDANGLRVLVQEKKSAPVVTFMVTYHVGSRDEVTGTTGATHLLEHLMFKGSERYDRSKGTGFDQVLERVGAETNATTWHDRTNYFATVPNQAFSVLVEIEADRMRNLALREEDRRPEMTVVRNEFERGENNPQSALDKELWAAAFIAHPYHHDTIGWRSDIEKVPISKLREFYDTYYWPNNATATVIGDIKPAEALKIIAQHYGKIPKSPKPFPEVYTQEPEQNGQRRVKVERAGELGVVALAHKIPPATHADWPAVQILSAILTNGKTSRSYRGLTDKNLTMDVSAFTGFNRDPSLHTIAAELAVGAKHEDVEKQLVVEIERVKKEGVTDAEVQTAVAKLLAERAFARDGTFASAAVINECIAVGDWTLFVTLDEKLKAVTAADVQRVAKDYLIERRSVAGWFVPSDESTQASAAVVDEKFAPKEVKPPQPPKAELPAPARTRLAEQATRARVAGVDVIVCPTEVKNVVTIRGSLAAGEAASPNRALAHLAAGMLERGTTKRDQFAIADLLEKVGVTLDFNVGTETVEFTGRCLTPDVPLVIELLAEQLRTPAFHAEEFSKLKTQLVSEAQQSLEDTDTQAAIAFSQAAFPVGHPSRKASIADLVKDLESAKLEDVQKFHRTVYGPATLRFVAVGDVKADVVKAEITKAFNGWAGGQPFAGPVPTSPKINDKVVAMPDKTSLSVVIGQPTGVEAKDPDWLALDLANAVLGRSFTSRLMGNVRDREGLTYGIGSRFSSDTFRPGAWYVRATFAPALLEKGLASTRREINDWYGKGITAAELAYRQSALAGQFAVALETTEGLSEQLLRCIERGFDIQWLDEYPSKLRALTLDQVNAAIKRHLDPAKMSTVKAGTL